jgi:tetratricopeptide (TPR) repeat protein
MAAEPAARLLAAKTDRAKAHYRRLKEQLLEQALTELQALQTMLADERQVGLPVARRDRLLLDCRWAMADCLYQLERYEETIRVCELICDGSPDAADRLQAHVQIANCYARMGRLEQARSILRIAQERLAELPPEEAARVKVGLRRERWEEWSADLTTLR